MDNTMRTKELKDRVSVADLLSYYGSTEHNKKWRCLFPSNHVSRGSHHSVDDYQNRAYCRSQECFGPQGADIFEIVGLNEPRLNTFEAQKAWIIETFTATYDYTDASGDMLYEDAQPRRTTHKRDTQNGNR